MRGENFKGKRPAGAGRRRGTPNRVTHDVRQALALIAEHNIENFESWLVAVKDPARRCEIFLKALAYHLPQLARLEASVTAPKRLEEMTDDELRALLGDDPLQQEPSKPAGGGAPG